MSVTLFYDVLDRDGDTLATFPLEEPRVTYRLSGVGDCSLAVALSHPELSDVVFGPKRTDFKVRMVSDVSGGDGDLMGGMCAPVALKSGEDRVRVGGNDWLAWLEQPYPFPGYLTDPETWTSEDVIKYWVEESQQTIIEDVLEEIYDGTIETIQYEPVFIGTGWLQEVDLQFIQLGDTQNIIDFIRSVGGLVEPYGFDFVCDPDKNIFFYAPRRVTAENAMPIALFTPSAETGLIEIDWQNNGPLSTAAVGMPTAALMKYHSYTPSRVMFRKWLEIIPLNEYYKTDFQAQQATNDIGGLHSNPQKDNTITILPHYMDPFDECAGFYNHCGQVVYVDSEDEFEPYHKIDAPYIVTEQEITWQGDWVCKLVLDQIY